MSEIRVWEIVPLSMVTTSEQERDKWIAAGHEVVEFVSIDRIKQLETELAAAKLSRLDKENLEIGRQLQRAANDLPDLFNIEIDVENGCAGVTLINEDRNRLSFILNEHLSDTISEAIDAAIKEQGK